MLGVLVCVACVLVSCARAHVPQCSEDVHCPVGSYCDMDARLCSKCVTCETHRRKPPKTASACIRSITECGPCIEKGDVSPECMGADGGGWSQAHVIWIVVIIVLVLVVLFFIVMYKIVLPGKRLIACEYMNVRPAASAAVQPQLSASAPPDCPPPYAPRPWEDYPPDFKSSSGSNVPQDDSSHSFINRDSKGRVSSTFESEENQAARPYGYPSYVRPPSYDNREPSPPRDVSEGDVDTRDSADTRDSNGNVVSVTSPGALASDSAAAAGDSLALASSPWQHQDRNNNDGTNCAPPAAPPASATFIINVTQSINAVQQQNNVKL